MAIISSEGNMQVIMLFCVYAVVQHNLVKFYKRSYNSISMLLLSIANTSISKSCTCSAKCKNARVYHISRVIFSKWKCKLFFKGCFLKRLKNKILPILVQIHRVNTAAMAKSMNINFRGVDNDIAAEIHLPQRGKLIS